MKAIAVFCMMIFVLQAANASGTDYQSLFVHMSAEGALCSGSFVDLSVHQDGSLIGYLSAQHCLEIGASKVRLETNFSDPDNAHQFTLNAQDAIQYPPDILIWIVSPQLLAASQTTLLKVAEKLPATSEAFISLGFSSGVNPAKADCNYYAQSAEFTTAHSFWQIVGLGQCKGVPDPSLLEGFSGGPSINSKGEIFGVNKSENSSNNVAILGFSPLLRSQLTGDPAAPIQFKTGIVSISNYLASSKGEVISGRATACLNENDELIGKFVFSSQEKNLSVLLDSDGEQVSVVDQGPYGKFGPQQASCAQ